MSWQILGLRYAENTNRRRGESFLFDAAPDAPHPMDFFFWVLRRGTETIVVDTGMDAAEGLRRGRPIREEPAAMLARIGIAASSVDRLILTHLHFDHAGALAAFPDARIEMQAAELAFAAGPAMANPTLRMPYSADHVAEIVRRLHAGGVRLHRGDVDLAPGIRGHLVGGHSDGLMMLTVDTARGPVILASDVAHYFEGIETGALFRIVSDPRAMARGLERLARHPRSHVLPGHDPALRRLYPEIAPEVYDLSAQPED